MDKWKRMPSDWVREKKILPDLRWVGDDKSAYTSALMVYFVFMHRVATGSADGQIGVCRLTYDDINTATGLSRSKISKGLSFLKSWGLASQLGNPRSGTFLVSGVKESYEMGIWAKFPAKGLYSFQSSEIEPFKCFKLRSKIELHALKLFLVILTFRDRNTNKATIGYDKINEYSGIARNDIAAASSFLVTTGLIRVSTESGEVNDFAVKNVYTPKFLDKVNYK